MDKPEFAYIGRKPCGCVVAMAVDDPDRKRKKHTGKMVGSWIADGLNIERVRCADARLDMTCPHGEQVEETEQARLFA
jgi:hypothetical protein